MADVRSEQWRTIELNGGGHRICPEGVVATGRVVGLGQGFYPLSGEGLG